jgi:hypothetical protein
LLESRVVLGEIHFGELENLEAHKPIVDRDLWNRVQRCKVTRGRRAKSDALLARQGILRCGTCGSRMVIGTTAGYPFYRCPPNADCPRRVTISAAIAEQVVIDAVGEALADVEGRASVEAHAREVERERARSQDDLDAGIRAFAGLEDEPAAKERLAELVADRDYWLGQEDQLGNGGASIVLTVEDWNRLTLDERRALIRATVARATISPGGKGAERITVALFV